MGGTPGGHNRDGVRQPVLGAFVRAAIAAIVFWMALYMVYALLTIGPTRAAQQVPYVLMGAILFVAPIVLLVLVLIAAPLFAALRLFRRITLPLAIAAGALCGLAGREAVHRLWGQPESDFTPVIVVLLAGAGAAAVWWRAWNHHEEAGGLRGTL